MKQKETVLQTKRLRLYPMSDEATRELINNETDPEMKQAYGEMLDGCVKHPENRVWYAPWAMVRKDTGESIGDLCFKGPQKDLCVEIGYGIHPEQEGKGYTTEAVIALTNWALYEMQVPFVEAQADPGNKASIRVLEKSGFKPDGTAEEGLLFVIQKAPTTWLPIYMCLGMSIGMAIGVSMKNYAIGMCLGMAAGSGIGALMQRSEQKKANELAEERKRLKKGQPG